MAEIRLQQGFATTEASTDTEALSSGEIVNSLVEKQIEVAEKDALAQSIDALREEFDIQPAAFNDFKRTLVLCAAAERLSTLDTENTTVGVYGAELEYISDIVMGIAGEYTAFYDEGSSKKSEHYVPSDEHQKPVYDKYSQPELCREFEEFIHGASFAELRTRLGVVEEEEFEVRVLSIDTGDVFGLVPSVDYGDDYGSLTWQEFEELDREREVRKGYETTLGQRTKQFMNELGREEAFAPAWVSTFDDGTRYLCVSSALAEKVMYSDEERAPYYNESDRVDDTAIIEHEYTHTQSMLTGGEIGLGIALEELRAEHFSGNHQGYTDIKKYFVGMKMLTGYHPADSFEIDGRPYDQDEFLADIARNVGLRGFLEAMTVMPANYVRDEHVSPFVKAMVNHNGGGISGQFRMMYERLINECGKDVIEERVSAFVDKVYDLLKDNEHTSVESWFAYGSPQSLRDLGIENFRRRYPDKSDGYDYGGGTRTD